VGVRVSVGAGGGRVDTVVLVGSGVEGIEVTVGMTGVFEGAGGGVVVIFRLQAEMSRVRIIRTGMINFRTMGRFLSFLDKTQTIIPPAHYTATSLKTYDNRIFIFNSYG
jgi:hypothetical protein